MKNFRSYLFFVPLLLLLLSSCNKEWLEEKPETRLAVPSTIGDFQALLDNTDNNSGAPFNVDQNLFNELGANDFYVSDADLNARGVLERNIYSWKPNMYENIDKGSEWDRPYKRIFYANIVSEGIDKVTARNFPEQTGKNQVKGSALFLRALNFYQVAAQYCLPYDETSAQTDPGIPIRLSSNINIPTTRASVQQTYEVILSDLKQAAALLPVETPVSDIYRLRPNKAAAEAMLARVYLSMRFYDSALVYAEKSLLRYNKLLDYNTLTVTATNFPVPPLNEEVLFHSTGVGWLMFSVSRIIIDPILYNSCHDNDLRKTVFFKVRNGSPRFYGSYSGLNGVPFTGLATDENYLIKAECLARKNRVQEALDVLNTLLRKRFKSTAVFQPLTAIDANDAITKILAERRKELVLRGIRWSDLRRLNKEAQHTVTLTRFVNGQQKTLAPNSPLYVLQIPPEVILLSGIQQNPR